MNAGYGMQEFPYTYYKMSLLVFADLLYKMDSTDELDYSIPKDSSLDESVYLDSIHLDSTNIEDFRCFKHFIKDPSLCSLLRASDLEFFKNTVHPSTYKILSDRIIVYDQTMEQVEQRHQKIQRLLINKLTRLPFFTVPSKRDIYILSESPSLQKILKQNRCTLVFNELKVYMASFERSPEELEKIKDRIVRHDMWPYQWRNPNHRHSVYRHIADYLTLAFQDKSQFFKQRNIQIQMNTRNSHVLIKGPEGYKKMEAKNTLRNIINSVAVMEIRSTASADQYKRLEAYLKKIIEHPIIFRKTGEGVYILITKDNITKQLLTKSKFRDFVSSTTKNMIGFFLLEGAKEGDKLQGLKTLVTNNHYFLEERDIFHYVVESMHISESKVEEYLDFIGKMLDYFIKTKTRSDTNLKFEEKKPPMDNNQFTEITETIPYKDTIELVQQFGCDIIMKKLYINFKYLKQYEEMEGDETANQLFTIADWCDPAKTTVLKIERQKLKGSYYYGKLKSNGNKKMYLPEHLIKTI